MLLTHCPILDQLDRLQNYKKICFKIMAQAGFSIGAAL